MACGGLESVTVLPEKDEESEAWLKLSAQGLADAYEDGEPEYPISSVREMNPNCQLPLLESRGLRRSVCR